MSLLINSYLFGIYTWTKTGPLLYGESIAMSSDGVKQTALARLGRIYTSTDSGVTWTARDSNRVWKAIAI